MTWRIDGPERNYPPEEFNEWLRFVGGVNKYDENNFKVGWAQYETFVSGGCWSVDEAHFVGYRRLLLGSGEPCWCLMQWHDAAEYGSPEAYYVSNYDESTGLELLGEFPYSGRYEVLYNLRWNEVLAGKITFHTMPLNSSILDKVAQIVYLAKDISVEKTKAAYLEAKAREEEAKLGEVERHLRDKALPQGAVSFTRQGIRSTVIDHKMRNMQQKWNQLAKAAKDFRPGIQTR